MAWPNRVYAATRSGGVYRTLNFGVPTDPQPIWEAYNDGLSALDVRSFCLDMSELQADDRMFCIDETNNTVWRREAGGVWQSVLTNAQATTLTGASDGEQLLLVITDHVTGYVYAIMKKEDAYGRHWMLRSIDHGTTWTLAYNGSRAFWYGTLRGFDAHNGLVVYVNCSWPLDHTYICLADDGTTITYLSVGGGNHDYNARLSHCDLGKWYSGVRGWYSLFRIDRAVSATLIAPVVNYGPYGVPGNIWLHETDPNTLATVRAGNIFGLTHDGGITLDVDHILPVGNINNIADNCEEDYWIFGCATPHVQDNEQPVSASVDGYTLTGRSGAMWDTSPYTDSIPVTCSGVTDRGLWAVFDYVPPNPWDVYDCIHELVAP